ncbi:MAG: DUF503 domain-containing protein [Clostridiales bacterium]|nr:DUF503 domain-containing protein [Clostridiales bacterium]
MVVGIIRIKIRIAWSHSLKEKRKVVKSICAKVQSKFKVSIAEVDEQDTHQIIVLGIAYVTNGNAHADSIASNIVNFIEGNVEGDLIEIEREIV